ncbi:serine protease [Leptospira noumeaensis]|uniref:Serine protease n=1 Tax=Leptospira noumeaensis TaxID=2484964 RepID=A0A4R9I679_9LEPT|nr:S1C family serine protease [Leptospira noumeaensis]TGK81621.1 serine protease [Leptospira noumeaensis]
MNKLLKFSFFFFLMSFSLLAQVDPEPAVDSIFRSVVLIRNEGFNTENKTQPWMKKNLYTGFGSGFVLPGQTILTNAHVVRDAKRILVKSSFTKKEYLADVKYIGYDCDLALLQVNDPDFSEQTNSLSFLEGIPNLGSDILLLGFPNGTDSLSVEKGSVLRFEKNRYTYSGLDYRNVLKINANIQPGNSGGPAVQNGKVVGLVFQISTLEQGIAYLISNDIIRHFLEDIGDGKYDGFPNIGFTFQNGNPKSLKQAMKVPASQSGIFVNRIYPSSTFSKVLKEKDFVTAVDGLPLTNDGEISQANKKEFIIDWIENKQLNSKVIVSYYRAGKQYDAEVNLQKNYALDLYRDSTEDYFLQAGFVFQPITRSFFHSEDGDLDSSLKYHYSYFIQDLLYRYTVRDIVLSYTFNDPETSKYKKYKYKVVESINGRIPKDLNEFKTIWKDGKKGFIVLKFRGMDLPIVIRPESVYQMNQRVKKRYGANYEEF